MSDSSPHAHPPAAAPPDLAVLAEFLIRARFRDQSTKAIALLAAYPGISFETVARAEVLAAELVRERAAGDRDDHLATGARE